MVFSKDLYKKEPLPPQQRLHKINQNLIHYENLFLLEIRYQTKNVCAKVHYIFKYTSQNVDNFFINNFLASNYDLFTDFCSGENPLFVCNFY